ncbi:MAG TPA: ATP-binding protein, partial [Gammaproteobacteria bacterium]|nr:ATP-binding protein [Gammaproteobacteria bacterium]
MEWLEILERIAAGESEYTEFKRGLGDLSAIGKAICAFANTDAGVIVLGVDDGGEIVGVREDPERVQERITDFLQSGCSSPVSANMGRHHSPEGWVHWIEVRRQRGLEPLRYSGRVWVRRGRSSVEPSAAELQELYNVFGYVLTEEQAIQAAHIKDIDLQVFRRYLDTLGIETDQEPQPETEDDLRNRGVLTEVGGELHPTL